MTLEQHGFELYRFTYEWIVFNKHIVQHDTWLVESVNQAGWPEVPEP